VVYVRLGESSADGVQHAQLEQDTGAQASLMAWTTRTAEVLAMVGGRGLRAVAVQPGDAVGAGGGSSFKTVCVHDGGGGGSEAG